MMSGLVTSVKVGILDTVRELLLQDGQYGPESTCTIDLNAPYDGDGNTLLHFAASNDNIPMVQLLIDRGADVNARANDGSTPLFRASFMGHLDIIQLLLDRGADIDAQNSKKNTALHYILQYTSRIDCFPVIKLLVANNADISIRNSQGKTAADITSRREISGFLTDSFVLK
jgi:ankyrin repeat protein